MPGKRVEAVGVVYFPEYNYIRVETRYTPANGNYESVVVRFNRDHLADRKLAYRKVKVLARRCFEDKSGRVRPFLAGHVGWLWERTPERLEGI